MHRPGRWRARHGAFGLPLIRAALRAPLSVRAGPWLHETGLLVVAQGEGGGPVKGLDRSSSLVSPTRLIYQVHAGDTKRPNIDHRYQPQPPLRRA